MSSPSSPTLDQVIENIIEEVLKERVKQLENYENAPIEEVQEENEIEEMEGDVADTRVFFTNKGEENFKKTLAKKGFVEQRGFMELFHPSRRKLKEGDGRCSVNT